MEREGGDGKKEREREIDRREGGETEEREIDRKERERQSWRKPVHEES